jgi:hypothetical protein
MNHANHKDLKDRNESRTAAHAPGAHPMTRENLLALRLGVLALIFLTQ